MYPWWAANCSGNTNWYTLSSRQCGDRIVDAAEDFVGYLYTIGLPKNRAIHITEFGQLLGYPDSGFTGTHYTSRWMIEFLGQIMLRQMQTETPIKGWHWFIYNTWNYNFARSSMNYNSQTGRTGLTPLGNAYKVFIEQAHLGQMTDQLITNTANSFGDVNVPFGYPAP